MWKVQDATDDFVLKSQAALGNVISMLVSTDNLQITVETDRGAVKRLVGGLMALEPDAAVATPVVPEVPYAPGDRIRVCDLTATLAPTDVTLSDGSSEATTTLQLVRPCPVDGTLDTLENFEPCVDTDGVHILVDASRDGGNWWSPQSAGAEDATANHAGRKLANALSEWGTVAELPREAWVSPMTLSCQDLVVRPSLKNLAAYHTEEIANYLDYVASGGVLLLLSDTLGSAGDPLAASFGLELAGSTTGRARVHFDQEDSLGQGVASLEFRGGACVTTAPVGSTEVASYDGNVYCDLDGDLAFDSGEPKGTPAAVRFAYGRGVVVWVADTDAIMGAPAAFLNNLGASLSA